MKTLVRIIQERPFSEEPGPFNEPPEFKHCNRLRSSPSQNSAPNLSGTVQDNPPPPAPYRAIPFRE